MLAGDRLSKKAREHKRRKDKGKFFSKTNIDQKQMHAYLKSLEVSNFKGFSAYFARRHPSEYTHTPSGSIRVISHLFGQPLSVSIGLSTRCCKYLYTGICRFPEGVHKYVERRSLFVAKRLLYTEKSNNMRFFNNISRLNNYKLTVISTITAFLRSGLFLHPLHYDFIY